MKTPTWPDKATAKAWIITYFVISVPWDFVSGRPSVARDLLIAGAIGAVLFVVRLSKL